MTWRINAMKFQWVSGPWDQPSTPQAIANHARGFGDLGAVLGVRNVSIVTSVLQAPCIGGSGEIANW